MFLDYTDSAAAALPRCLLVDQLHELRLVVGGGRQRGQPPLHAVQATQSKETHQSTTGPTSCFLGLLHLPRPGACHH